MIIFISHMSMTHPYLGASSPAHVSSLVPRLATSGVGLVDQVEPESECLYDIHGQIQLGGPQKWCMFNSLNYTWK